MALKTKKQDVVLVCQDTELFKKCGFVVTETAAVLQFDWKLMAIYHPEIKQEMGWCGNELLKS